MTVVIPVGQTEVNVVVMMAVVVECPGLVGEGETMVVGISGGPGMVILDD